MLGHRAGPAGAVVRPTARPVRPTWAVMPFVTFEMTGPAIDVGALLGRVHQLYLALVGGSFGGRGRGEGRERDGDQRTGHGHPGEMPQWRSGFGERHGIPFSRTVSR